MRIGVISDLHVDLNEASGQPLIEEVLLEVVAASELQHLIIAGDISNDVNRSMAVLRRLKAESGIPVLFVPGNHDYWSKDNGITDTWEIYRQYQSYEGCLSQNPIQLDDDWVVIGNSGWYDYTMGEPKYSFADFEKMHAMDRTWQDSIYVKWNMSNQEIHRYFYRHLEQELERHQGQNIILVTHMLTHPYFKAPVDHPQWQYFNAFLGSNEYAELYHKYKVRYGIMGHVHYRKRMKEQETEMICACLGYRKEWRTTEALKEVQDCLQIISI